MSVLNQGTRRFRRFRRTRPVVVTHPDVDCTYQRLVLVGRGGAELVCNASLPTGAVVGLEICLAGGVIRARGRVVGSRPAGEGHLVGIAFLELPPEDEELLAALLEDRD